MAKIHQLSLQDAQKIAAGQVVERPASVIKELIENSIDAGSTRIEIYIEEAGQKLLRIVDNGCGMSPEDAQLSFNRHATSKITQIDQLPNVTTFGFRGEALASITAVSKVTLITREKTAQEGIKIVRQEEKNYLEPVSCNTGTDISVKNLFYNVPARKKFLKKELTEWRHIHYTVQALCFSYTIIHFKLYNDGKLVYNCPPTTFYKDRMAQLWDITIAKNTVNISKTTKNDITIEGAITNQQYYRYDRNSIFLFVNNRWIKNQKITRALLKGYMNVLPLARYPAAIISITVDPLQVDINVHPRKEEVTFLHPRRIETLLTQTIRETLENHLSEQLHRTVHKQKSSVYTNFPQKNYSVSTTITQSHTPGTKIKPQISPSPSKIDIPTSVFQQAFTTNATSEKTTSSLSDFQLIGQLHNTYILLEQKDGLFIIDQHAAHERILYEQFKKERFTSITTVELLFPVTMEVTKEQLLTLQPYLEVLYEHGLQVEQFGNKQLIIKAAPVSTKHIDFDKFIKEIIGWITETQNLDTQDIHKSLHEKIHAQMACKAAVKAGDKLLDEHIKQLIKDISKTKNRFTCPHGRPTGWSISFYEIEKKFKRKL